MPAPKVAARARVATGSEGCTVTGPGCTTGWLVPWSPVSTPVIAPVAVSLLFTSCWKVPWSRPESESKIRSAWSHQGKLVAPLCAPPAQIVVHDPMVSGVAGALDPV